MIHLATTERDSHAIILSYGGNDVRGGEGINKTKCAKLCAAKRNAVAITESKYSDDCKTIVLVTDLMTRASKRR